MIRTLHIPHLSQMLKDTGLYEEDKVKDPLQEITEERARQDAKWGEQNHFDLYWLGILMEEVGELAKEIIEKETTLTADMKRKELIQVAAVAVAWLEAMNRRAQA